MGSGGAGASAMVKHPFLFRCLEAASGGSDRDVLSRGKCLQALAALRHTKWFQVCVTSSAAAQGYSRRLLGAVCERGRRCRGSMLGGGFCEMQKVEMPFG